jgi:hypothetical protein
MTGGIRTIWHYLYSQSATHRAQLTDLEQVDDELIKWIKEAYENAK